MEEQVVTLPWSTRKRLHYLEFKLFWEGRVNRGDLTAEFGISIPQASVDFTKYQELASNNIAYNPSAKHYVPTEAFHPIFIKLSADAYFSRALSSASVENSSSFDINYIDTVPSPTRIVNMTILKSIIQAIKFKQKITVDYRSFKNPQAGNNRFISPHAFGYDGFRWHVRAYCHSDNKFKDYVLGRIVSVSNPSDSDVDSTTDKQWFNFIDVIIGPNPKLTDDQKHIVAMDYGMIDYKLNINCRIALLWYLLKKLGIDVNESTRSGEEQQIVAINRDEIIVAMNQ
ncbi:MAG: WYL domain-containing protein [Geobacter sp.]|nr:WYL domain-containing protein [Geobacter sp.]